MCWNWGVMEQKKSYNNNNNNNWMECAKIASNRKNYGLVIAVFETKTKTNKTEQQQQYFHTMMVHFDWTIDWFVSNYASETNAINFVFLTWHSLLKHDYLWMKSLFFHDKIHLAKLLIHVWIHTHTHSLHLDSIHRSIQAECILWRKWREHNRNTLFLHGHLFLLNSKM